MTAPAFEDLDDFFHTDEFAIEVVFDGGSPVKAIMDADFIEAGEATVGIEGDQPRLTCKAQDVNTVQHGSTVVADGDTYTVRGIEPDGSGLVRFVLEAV